MSNEEVDLVWQVMGTLAHCMMTVNGSDRLHARPMTGVARRETNAIWFAPGESFVELIEQGDGDACLTFVNDVQSIFLSVSGNADVVRDPSQVDDVINALRDQCDGAFVSQNVGGAILRFTPEVAEYWRHPRSELMVALDALTSGGSQTFNNGKQTNGLVHFMREER